MPSHSFQYLHEKLMTDDSRKSIWMNDLGQIRPPDCHIQAVEDGNLLVRDCPLGRFRGQHAFLVSVGHVQIEGIAIASCLRAHSIILCFQARIPISDETSLAPHSEGELH